MRDVKSFPKQFAEFIEKGAHFIYHKYFPGQGRAVAINMIMIYRGQAFIFDSIDPDEDMSESRLRKNEVCISFLNHMFDNELLCHSIILFPNDHDIKNINVSGTNVKVGHICDAERMVKQCLAFNLTAGKLDDNFVYERIMAYRYKPPKKFRPLPNDETEMKSAGRKIIVLVIFFLVLLGVIPTICVGTRYLEKETEFSETYRQMVPFIEDMENYTLNIVNEAESNGYELPEDDIIRYKEQMDAYLTDLSGYEDSYNTFTKESGKYEDDFYGVYNTAAFIADTCKRMLSSVEVKGENADILCRLVRSEVKSLNKYVLNNPVYGVRYKSVETENTITFEEYTPWYRKVLGLSR